jgi:signal transduction histidine kinase
MPMTIAELARELRATLEEATVPIDAALAGNIPHAEATVLAREPLERMERALRDIESGGGIPDPARVYIAELEARVATLEARLDAKDEALRLLRHELLDGVTVLKGYGQLAELYAERAAASVAESPPAADMAAVDLVRTAAAARRLVGLLNQRIAAIEAGVARALAVGREGERG